MRKSNVVGRLVQVAAVEGVGKVRVGRDVEWNEYRVQAWDVRGRLVAEYHTDDKTDALDSAERMLADLADLVKQVADQAAARLAAEAAAVVAALQDMAVHPSHYAGLADALAAAEAAPDQAA
jgi:hypothetical protein